MIALQLTDSGKYLLTSALAGKTLTFSKLAIGSGAEPNSADSLTELINLQIEMAIEKYTVESNYVTLKGSFSNSELTEGFNWTETGVYAKDEDGNEVLYAYCNDGEEYSYIPSETDGKVLSTSLTIVVAVDDVENIAVDLGSNNTYATTEELNEVEKALKNALDSHTHALEEDDISGTLPISKGGTGGTDKETARENLGLGEAAKKDVDATVTEGSNNLVSSGAVYSALMDIEGADTSDFLSKSNGGTVAGVLEVDNNLNTNDVIPTENEKYSVGSAAKRYLAGHFKEVYADDIKFLRLSFNCTEVEAYNFTYPDATIYCEMQRYEPETEISYDSFVNILEDSGGMTTDAGYSFTSVTKAEVDSDTDSYYDSSAVNTVYACVYGGNITSLIVTVCESISFIGSTTSDYSDLKPGEYLADVGDKIKVGAWISEEINGLADKYLPLSGGVITGKLGIADENGYICYIYSSAEDLVFQPSGSVYVLSDIYLSKGSSLYLNKNGSNTSVEDVCKPTTVTVAAYTSLNKYKYAADYVSTSASGDRAIIASAVSACPKGGTVLLLPGEYIFDGTSIDITKAITITGGSAGAVTVRAGNDSPYVLFSLNGENITLKDMTIRLYPGSDGSCTQPIHILASNVTVKRCVFDTEEGTDGFKSMSQAIHIAYKSGVTTVDPEDSDSYIIENLRIEDCRFDFPYDEAYEEFGSTSGLNDIYIYGSVKVSGRIYGNSSSRNTIIFNVSSLANYAYNDDLVIFGNGVFKTGGYNGTESRSYGLT